MSGGRGCGNGWRIIYQSSLDFMTTREEMALAFARDHHQELMRMINERKITTEREVDEAIPKLIEDSVVIADLLLLELNKRQPPIRPQVDLKDGESGG